MAKIFAGTMDGVFVLENGGVRQVLEASEVRDLVVVGGRIFASTGRGVYLSNDQGDNWVLSGITDRQVWQVSAFSGDIHFAVTQPTGLFRSDDGGENWQEIESLANLSQASKWCLPLTPPVPARAVSD